MKKERQWLAPNSGQARKEDLRDVCEVLQGALAGQVYRYDPKLTVHELRVEMRRLLVSAAASVASERERAVAEVEASLPSPFGVRK